jgi:hypothetical protein
LSTYYKFKPTAGYALAITDDMTGANLPPVQYGRWALVETLELLPGDGRPATAGMITRGRRSARGDRRPRMKFRVRSG